MSRPGMLWQVSVRLSGDTPDEEVGELLSAWFSRSASIHRDLKSGITTVALYLESKPAWSIADRRRLAEALARIPGLEPARRFKPTLSPLKPENWAETWKRHFKPLEIGERLLIRPSWSRRRPRPHQQEVVLDPGMSFGTGQHPTTSFCLEELVRARRYAVAQSFLDVGTGSGILAISAAKLGYRPIRAFDLDRDAVAIARANARTNRVETAIRFECRDLAAGSGPARRSYQVVCANLLANLLIAENRRLAGLVSRGGVLVVAGILESEFHEVRRSCETAGLRLLRSRGQDEWRSGCFKK